MFFKQTMHQIQPDREFGGQFFFGEKVYDYNVLFRVPVSKMAEECEKRQKTGDDITAIEFKREHFILMVKERAGKSLDLSDDKTYEFLSGLAVAMAVKVSESEFTEGFNELFGQAMQESCIEESEEWETANVAALPWRLRAALGV
jgi:hypothetical protein